MSIIKFSDLFADKLLSSATATVISSLVATLCTSLIVRVVDLFVFPSLMRLVRRLLLNITTPRSPACRGGRSVWLPPALTYQRGDRRCRSLAREPGLADRWRPSEDVGSGRSRSASAASGGGRRGAFEPITKAACGSNRRPSLRSLELCGLATAQGPVFLELPLDVQAAAVDAADADVGRRACLSAVASIGCERIAQIAARLAQASRPVLLIGGGVERATGLERKALRDCGLPLMTTYNGADRVDNQLANYFGRPNTWGMRYATSCCSRPI